MLRLSQFPDNKAFSFRKRKALVEKKSIDNIINKEKRVERSPFFRKESPWVKKMIYNIINKRKRVKGETLGFSLKGQWFLISAVIASGAFLAISILFNNYFVVDTSEPALIDEGFYFNSVKDGMERTIDLSDCTNMDRNLKSFTKFSEEKIAGVGYFLHVEYTINSCAAKDVYYGILLASDRYARCDNIADPQAIVPGINC